MFRFFWKTFGTLCSTHFVFQTKIFDVLFLRGEKMAGDKFRTFRDQILLYYISRRIYQTPCNLLSCRKRSVPDGVKSQSHIKKYSSSLFLSIKPIIIGVLENTMLLLWCSNLSPETELFSCSSAFWFWKKPRPDIKKKELFEGNINLWLAIFNE